MYTARASKCVHVRDTYECVEITENQVILSCCTQDEVIERFGENNGDLVAESLVEQLLKIVTKDLRSAESNSEFRSSSPLQTDGTLQLILCQNGHQTQS